MTDRERLIELIRKAKKNTKGAICDLEREMLFADYLLENGVILPPCKVGDELYAISDTRIMECTCYDMNIGNKVMICASFKCDYVCEACPFCGGEAVIHNCAEVENESLKVVLTDKVGVHCKHCGIATLPLPDEETAIEAWNRRVDNG